MLILNYPSKKELKACVGQRLKYIDPAVIGASYKAEGVVYGSNRPAFTGHKREFYARITMAAGLIKKVE
jgi:hypothetical protein